jgi:ribose 5-phosphate isomerase RpiB
MIYTARQIEDLWKANGANGQVILPYRARLSPLASDFIKSKKITLGFSDGQPAGPCPSAPPSHSPAASTQPFLYWCEGPCGTAKAALMAVARESSLAESPVASDSGKLIAAIKQIAGQVKGSAAAGGILVVAAGAEALVYANRCPSLRAIVGTCLETVEQGIQNVAANVLVIEHPHKTLQQIRNMIGRFVRAKRNLSDEVKASLKELSSCG